MAQPVWVLSVDLQTKTATFTSGLGEAAKSARSTFQEIKAGANEMGRETGYSMMEARHGVMLLGEEFGVHLPRALTSFIASLGPVGSAMSAAFPFLAIAVGATLLLEHLHKLKEEGEQLTDSQMKFGTTVANVLNGLNDRLLEAGIRADNLRGNHLAALEKQLQLIDHTSMAELTRAFDTIAVKADATFTLLRTGWYQFGAGSAGAKHALESFKSSYDLLIEQGKDKDASDLLAGTLKSAERVLALQKQVKDNQVVTGTKGTHGDYAKAEAAVLELKKQGIGYTDKEVESQRLLVETLQAQVAVQSKVNAIKSTQEGNAIQTYNNDELINLVGRADKIRELHNKMAEEDKKAAEERERLEEDLTHYLAEEWQKRLKVQEEAAKEDAEHISKMGELKVAAEREQAELSLSAMRNSEMARLAVEKKLEDEEYQSKLTANARELAGLDKSAKDYQTKLKAINDKEIEITQEHENKLTAIKLKAEEDRNKRVLSAEERADDAAAKGMTDVLMRRERFSKMMVSLGDQVASGLIQNAIKSMLADDMTKERDAAAAARKAYLAGMHFPFPTNLVMAPLLAAGAFTAVMAFEQGGIVPGNGVGDTQPAILTPGESVNSKRLTEGLTRMVSASDAGKESHVHLHATFAPQVQAFDRDGVDRVLKEHADTFHRHIRSHIRRLNK